MGTRKPDTGMMLSLINDAVDARLSPKRAKRGRSPSAEDVRGKRRRLHSGFALENKSALVLCCLGFTVILLLITIGVGIVFWRKAIHLQETNIDLKKQIEDLTIKHDDLQSEFKRLIEAKHQTELTLAMKGHHVSSFSAGK